MLHEIARCISRATRRLGWTLAALAALSGCETDAPERPRLNDPRLAHGDLCDQLHYAIRQGASGVRVGAAFPDIRGRRLDEYRLLSTLTLRGASACIIDDSLGRLSARYVCTFGEARLADRGELVATLNRLERQVDACLARQNRFGYSDRGRSMPRYEANGRLAGEVPERVWFSDRYANQDVNLEIEDLGQVSRVLLSFDALN